MALMNMIVYYVCAAIWLYRALERHSISDHLVTFIFMVVGIVWTFRYVKQKNDKE